MDKHTFSLFLQNLTDVGLTSSRHVQAGEKLMIFMCTISGKSNRDCQEHFQHSGSSISKFIHKVADCIAAIQADIITLPPLHATTPKHIASNSKYFPYFGECIGAFDGMHVPAVLPVDIAPAF